MQLNQISENTIKLIVEPTVVLPKLFNYFQTLLQKSKSELEFVSRHRKLAYDLFSCRELEDYEFVQRDTGLLKTEYKSFKEIIELVISNHELLEADKQFGTLIIDQTVTKYTFAYTYTEKYIIPYQGICLDFNITNQGEEETTGFSFILRIMENGEDLKVVDLYPDPKKKYIGKKISIGMILHVKNKFKKRIISSSNKSSHNLYCEFNSEDAVEKVWKRLEGQGLVKYQEKEDYYYTV